MSKLEIVSPSPSVHVADLHKNKGAVTTLGTEKPVNHERPASHPSTMLMNKQAAMIGFCEACLKRGVNPLSLLKSAEKKEGEAPRYKDRPAFAKDWTAEQWRQYVASTGHTMKKKADFLGGLAGAGLGAGVGSAVTIPLLATLNHLASKFGAGAGTGAGVAAEPHWYDNIIPDSVKNLKNAYSNTSNSAATFNNISSLPLGNINAVGTGLGGLAGGYIGHKLTSPQKEHSEY